MGPDCSLVWSRHRRHLRLRVILRLSGRGGNSGQVMTSFTHVEEAHFVILNGVCEVKNTESWRWPAARFAPAQTRRAYRPGVWRPANNLINARPHQRATSFVIPSKARNLREAISYPSPWPGRGCQAWRREAGEGFL